LDFPDGNILYRIWAACKLIFIHKISIMGNLLYIIAVILVIAWAIGFLGYHAGGIIHILLVIAIVVVLLKVIRGSAD
jgi:tryptophan-rich sensory protein